MKKFAARYVVDISLEIKMLILEKMSPTCRRLVGDNFVSGTTSSQILLLILCGIVGDMTAICRRHVADNVVVVERHYYCAQTMVRINHRHLVFLSYTMNVS